MVFFKYCDIFPGTLPTQAPPNQKLGDIHEIPLEEGAKPKQKSMYRHSPQELLLIKKSLEELLEVGAI